MLFLLWMVVLVIVITGVIIVVVVVVVVIITLQPSSVQCLKPNSLDMIPSLIRQSRNSP